MIQENGNLTSSWVDLETFDVDAATVTLNIAVERLARADGLTPFMMLRQVTAEYVGTGVDSSASQFVNLGSTWRLAFSQFNEYSSEIFTPDVCENRKAADFGDATVLNEWEAMWQFASQPYQALGLGQPDTLAYPPTDGTFYELGMADPTAKTCSPIRYTASFAFNDLLTCTDDNGTRAVTLSEDDEFITLAGTFYVALVGTFRLRDDANTHVYRCARARLWRCTPSPRGAYSSCPSATTYGC